MTHIKNIRALLANGKTTMGTWLQLNSADVAELLAQAGYDWVVVDMEHGAFSRSDLPCLFRAIRCAGAVPMVRVCEAKSMPIKAALDAGAQGLIFPRIDNYEQLNAAIHHALYPHLGGQRGYGYCNANSFGMDFELYNNDLANDLFFVAQIEHINAVNNLESIVSHQRLDAIMVGPYDLSGSMNIVGQFEHADFQAAMLHIKKVCNIRGITMGVHIAQPDQQSLLKYISEGYSFIAYGIDSVFLWHGARRPLVG